MSSQPVTDFLKHHFRHFNAASLIEAADAYKRHLDRGGKMLLAMAGAMSTAEIGLSLAEMIRQDCVHAISCTGPTSKKMCLTWLPTMTMNACPTTATSPRPRKPTSSSGI